MTKYRCPGCRECVDRPCHCATNQAPTTDPVEETIDLLKRDFDETVCQLGKEPKP